MQNARLDESLAGSKITRKNINKQKYADDTTLMTKDEGELKSLLMRMERRAWKSWLEPQHSEN